MIFFASSSARTGSRSAAGPVRRCQALALSCRGSFRATSATFLRSASALAPVVQGVVTAGALLVQVGVLGVELQQGGEVLDRLGVAPEALEGLAAGPQGVQVAGLFVQYPGRIDDGLRPMAAAARGHGPQAANLEVVGADRSCDRQVGERIPKAPVRVRQGPEPGVGIGVEGIDPPGDGRLRQLPLAQFGRVARQLRMMHRHGRRRPRHRPVRRLGVRRQIHVQTQLGELTAYEPQVPAIELLGLQAAGI